ncbi:Bardet-Biedl syndrome 2 protein-like isoform X2 [Leptotrombidium deliense]|uniref:Bardet-Biedl syndrome 2 protein homolog n=1 Tax=Leptotrombidium deliense TaxID=299467 RepID=A0A443SIM3_9ACAR|nr:Bardet-Biedl syndrome 2 protein-like isoform X2 [Leptotrombidium deliense]
MMRTVFTVDLNAKVIAGKVAIGKFDGNNPCIVAATNTDKVLVHNPYSRSVNADGKWVLGATATDVNFLNINQTVNALAAGKLKPGHENDYLVIGTPTSILVYDVINNVDVFYRDIPDGSNAVVVGKIGSCEKPLAIAGGNCALQGFDVKGDDCYWTVTGDNITALTLCDIDEDGTNEEDVIAYELSETDAIKCLCPVSKDCFAYALSNGTVGVYLKKERLWRIKSKNQAVSIFSFDVNGDGIPELVTGWSSGKLDARTIENGEVIFKDNLNHSIALITTADYNMDGVEELVVCSVNGEVRGYVPSLMQERQSFIDTSEEQEILRELMRKKQNLLMELRNYEGNQRLMDEQNSIVSGKATTEEDEFGAIPSDTQLKSSLILNTAVKRPHIELSLQTTNDTVIRSVVLFAEGIFSGESQMTHPKDNEVSNSISVPLRPPKDIAIDVHVKALVGYKGSYHFHVFELTRHLPRFAMFSVVKGHIPDKSVPNGSVTFTINERVPRILAWIDKNFLLDEEIDTKTEVESVAYNFISLRDGKMLCIEMNGRTGHVVIKTENMELAGLIIQSLCGEFFNLEDLNSVANFPGEVDNLRKYLTKVEEIQSVRQQLGADIADNSGAVRALVVKAEDARLLGEYKLMKQHYLELHSLNRELINEYKIRSQNHQDLVDALKQVNAIIQKAGNLRLGPSKTRLIQACRMAIKQNNFNSMARIITEGEA